MNKNSLTVAHRSPRMTENKIDRQAFIANCYEQYQKDLLRIALTLSRDLAEAEDKLQNFFLEKIMRPGCIDALPAEKSSRAVFIRVMFRNYLRSKWRKEKRYHQLHRHLDHDEWTQVQQRSDETETIDWSAQLQQLTQQMSPTAQQLINLKMEKHSNQKIAELTGRTVDSVKSCYSRSKNQLRVIALRQRDSLQRA
ncbi:MAG: sigma-70 family RNA polymerase sigma factor [Bacteroidota bacterium]